jgi:hypothetical protein
MSSAVVNHCVSEKLDSFEHFYMCKYFEKGFTIRFVFPKNGENYHIKCNTTDITSQNKESDCNEYIYDMELGKMIQFSSDIEIIAKNARDDIKGMFCRSVILEFTRYEPDIERIILTSNIIRGHCSPRD